MRIRSRWFNWLQAAAIVVVCKLLFRTLRIHFLPAAPTTNPYENDGSQGFIYSVWHDEVVFPMFGGRHVRTVALVSKHDDGSHLGFGLKMLNIGIVQGSSSRKGAEAIRELLRTPENSHIVITPDGPRGPRHQAKPGLILIAARSGRAIVPTAFAATSCWRIPGRWTDLVIPKPFSRVYALGGQPIYVPKEANQREFTQFLFQVQGEMDRLNGLAVVLAQKKCRNATQIEAVVAAGRESAKAAA
jgi:lysophospholipid acyltransferase (LPLAT)-like uncharacterized protein